ncbi:hypothetical protein GQ43DRAFT_249920 [Delitschia confertaspora ATCC 74209]|uniref:Uncharacterized protein n=1 Tax=Delitschia confertaspora ATCC 74209 TaxID=1513339 RepID=A0A9P4JQT8_9PLEO|nr:hypothetical protein GQ43DRAFT_249920 [Delitschia confertaspora ATCC 74209]
MAESAAGEVISVVESAQPGAQEAEVDSVSPGDAVIAESTAGEQETVMDEAAAGVENTVTKPAVGDEDTVAETAHAENSVNSVAGQQDTIMKEAAVGEEVTVKDKSTAKDKETVAETAQAEGVDTKIQYYQGNSEMATVESPGPHLSLASTPALMKTIPRLLRSLHQQGNVP